MLLQIFLVLIIIWIKIWVLGSHFLLAYAWWNGDGLEFQVFYVAQAAVWTATWCIVLGETNDTRLHLVEGGVDD